MSDAPGPAACSRCGGHGFVHRTVAGRDYAQRCRCTSAGRDEALLDPLQAAGLPPGLRHCTLGNFVPRTDALQGAYRRALGYCASWPRMKDEGLGLLFWGPSGTGKSHLAAAVLGELCANHGVRGRFRSFAALLGEITRSYDERTRLADLGPFEAVLSAELLVLDDVGSGRMTDWAGDTLFDLLNSRYSSRRPTVLTTRYEDVDAEVARHAGAAERQEFLSERVGPRVRSRLLEMSVFVPMQEPRPRRTWRPSRPSTLGAMRRKGQPGG